MRQLTPELLDHLAHDDPGAIRSRRDLRRINRFMGNDGWIIRNIPSGTDRIIELGAGDGALLTKIHARFPKASLTAYDLAPRPGSLAPEIVWKKGNIFQCDPELGGGTLVANLVLHHFTDDQLEEISPWLTSFDNIITNEPLRAGLPLFLGKLAFPFIHPITRHDMRVSIEAGFVTGELPALLRLDGKGFSVRESSTWRGSQRMLASRA